MYKRISSIMIVLITLLVVGCSADYKFGDISKSYCDSTEPEFRQMIKDQLVGAGIVVGVDYCTTHNLIDTMLSIGKPIDNAEPEPDTVKIINDADLQNQNFERMYHF